MPKARLIEKLEQLESDIMSTMLAGLKEWRPDLIYPQSHSDMQACIRPLLQLYNIERRDLSQPLKYKCCSCEGLGKYIWVVDGVRNESVCKECQGKGYIV